MFRIRGGLRHRTCSSPLLRGEAIPIRSAVQPPKKNPSGLITRPELQLQGTIMHIHNFASPVTAGWLATLIPVAVQFVIFLRWLHRRMGNEEITRAFVRDIATNHLPHIYNALQKIAAEQGITLDETPLVQFVDLNHRRRRE